MRIPAEFESMEIDLQERVVETLTNNSFFGGTHV
jgi:hypothetical protein